MWLHNKRLQRLGGGFGERLAVSVLSRIQFFMLGAHKDPAVVKFLRQIRRERKSLLTAFESYILYSLAHSQACLPGQMAEVGVYAGASARVISEVKGNKTLYLFDTFEGLPEASSQDRAIHRENQYTCTLESVRAYLAECSDVHLHQGLFPQSAGPIENETFCFVHLDVDLYQSTLDALKFFYSRLVPGAILLSHDYSLLEGVKTAFQEFLADKPERLIELPTTQCMFIKR